MRRGTIVIVLLALLGCFQLAAVAEAATTRPIVYGKTQWEWAGPEGDREYREWGGIYATLAGSWQQLTHHPWDREPNVSPDGSTIAFIREGDVYVMNADGSGQRQLTGAPALDEHPQISPNGRCVLFTRRAAGLEPRDLYTIPLAGGEPHALTNGAWDDREPSFSPDGRAIVFVRELPGGEFGGNDELFSIRPSGIGLARLTKTRQDEGWPRYFARGIFFHRRNAPRLPLVVFAMRRNGEDVRPVVRRKTNSRVGTVSPDGRLLLFISHGLWKKRLLPTGSWSPATWLGGRSSEYLVFSPDGRRIAGTFPARGGWYSLSSIDVRTGQSRGEGAGGGEIFEPEGPGPIQTSIGPVIAW